MSKRLTKKQQQVVVDNLPLVYEYMKKKSLDPDEYEDLMFIALCNAAKTYDASVNFSTWAWACMSGEFRRDVAHKTAKKRIPAEKLCSLNEKLKRFNEEKEYIDIMTDEQTEEEIFDKLFLDSILNRLSEKDRDIIVSLMEGQTLQEIGNRHGVSHQRIEQRRKAIRDRFIKNKLVEEKNGYHYFV